MAEIDKNNAPLFVSYEKIKKKSPFYFIEQLKTPLYLKSAFDGILNCSIKVGPFPVYD